MLVKPDFYNGEEPDGFAEWFDRFIVISAANNWDEERQKCVFPAMLKGTAFRLFKQLGAGEKDTMEDIRAHMMHKLLPKYKTRGWKLELQDQIRSRGESVDDFMLRLEQLANKAYLYDDDDMKREALKMQFILGQGCPNTKLELLKLENTDLRQLIAKAKTIEAAREVIHRQPKKVDTKPPTNDGVGDGKIGDTWQMVPRRKTGIKCYTCGLIGHFSKNCSVGEGLARKGAEGRGIATSKTKENSKLCKGRGGMDIHCWEAGCGASGASDLVSKEGQAARSSWEAQYSGAGVGSVGKVENQGESNSLALTTNPRSKSLKVGFGENCRDFLAHYTDQALKPSCVLRCKTHGEAMGREETSDILGCRSEGNKIKEEKPLREYAREALKIDRIEQSMGRVGANLPMIDGRLGDEAVKILIDSGAMCTLISSELMQGQNTVLQPSLMQIKGVTGHSLRVVGEGIFPFVINDQKFFYKAVVVEGLKYDVILGYDIMKERGYILDFSGLKNDTGVKGYSSRMLLKNSTNIPPLSGRCLRLKPEKHTGTYTEFIIKANELQEDGVYVEEAVSYKNEHREILVCVINENLHPVRLEHGTNLATAEGVAEGWIQGVTVDELEFERSPGDKINMHSEIKG